MEGAGRRIGLRKRHRPTLFTSLTNTGNTPVQQKQQLTSECPLA